MSSHRRTQTHRQIPREIEAGVPENRSQKKQSAPQKPTDPWVFGYAKPQWETGAETLWETEVWYLLCARMPAPHLSAASIVDAAPVTRCEICGKMHFQRTYRNKIQTPHTKHISSTYSSC